MPIGNLTSQIFANIYLNELDRFVKHELKAKAYLRYGDDFIILYDHHEKLVEHRNKVETFLKDQLKLQLHSKSDLILRIKDGLRFLGVVLYSAGGRLNDRNQQRVLDRLDVSNAGSYWGMVKQYEKKKYLKQFQWELVEILDDATSF